jgi:hypothetical protein
MASLTFFFAVLIARLAAGIALFLAAAVVSGSASSAARARSAVASSFSASRTQISGRCGQPGVKLPGWR